MYCFYRENGGGVQIRCDTGLPVYQSLHALVGLNMFIANEPAERRRSAGEAAENSAARRMVYAKKFSIGIEKCKCKV